MEVEQICGKQEVFVAIAKSQLGDVTHAVALNWLAEGSAEAKEEGSAYCSTLILLDDTPLQ
jgi:hypothetical protein